MGIKDFAIRFLAKRYQMTDSLSFIEAMEKVGTQAPVAMPTDLLPMAGRLFSRALYTQMAIQPNLDWVLPYWAQRQCDPSDISFLPRMNWAQFNLTHRNWTAVGLPGSTREVVIDPRGWVVPWFEGWSLDTWVELDGELLLPSREKSCRQKHIENLPVVLTIFEKEKFRLELETFVTIVSQLECVMLRARIVNTSAQSINPRLFFSIRPFNPEGGSLVFSIEAVADDSVVVNDSGGIYFHSMPERIVCSNGREGDSFFQLDANESKKKSECSGGLANAYAAFSMRINPQEEQERIVCATTSPQNWTPKSAKKMCRYDYHANRADTKATWRVKIKQGMSIDLPDKALTQSFYLTKSHLLLADDGDYITPGPMTYHHYWFRDSAYMVTALDRIGMHEDARRKLENYPSRQQPDGFFLSQPGEWDSAGQAIWTLAEHYRITGDKLFLEKMFDSMVKGASWIVAMRKKANEKGPTKGLFPAGFSAEHFGPNDIYYWDDFWGAAGLRDVANSAEDLGLRSEWVRYEKEASDFLADIRASLKLVEERLGQPVMPTGPFRRFDCAAIGTIAALYPLRLFDAFDPLLENTLEQLHKQCMFENGFFQQMIHSGINMYLTLHMAHCHLFRRESRVWPLIKYVLGKATSTGTWPEAIHPATGGGCMGDGMHIWAAADWLLILRDLLLFEEGDTLVVTPAPLEDWFEWGAHIEVQDAPTYFGPLSYRIEGRESEVVLELDATWRHSPLKIEWNLPFESQQAIIDGREVNVNDTRVLAPGGVSEIRVKRY